MKINIIKGKSTKHTSAVETVVKKLFPSAKVNARTKFTFDELKDSYVLDVDKVYAGSNREIAENVLRVLDIGVSDSVLKSL